MHTNVTDCPSGTTCFTTTAAVGVVGVVGVGATSVDRCAAVTVAVGIVMDDDDSDAGDGVDDETDATTEGRPALLVPRAAV